MLTAVIFCPIAAGLGAVHGGAHWLAIPFIPIGFAVGVCIFLYARAPVYAITGFGISRYSRMRRGLAQWLVALPFFLVYMILPLVMVWGAAFGVFVGSKWLVRHLL